MIKIILLFIMFSFGCNAQNKLLDILPLKDSKVNYSNVLEVKGVTQDTLHKRARHWTLNSGNYINEIIHINDEYKQIDSKGFFKELWGPNDYPELYTDIFYTVNFKFRNERYKYEITNFIVIKNGTETQLEIFNMENKKTMKYNKLFYERIDEQIKYLIISIEKSMSDNKLD